MANSMLWKCLHVRNYALTYLSLLSALFLLHILSHHQTVQAQTTTPVLLKDINTGTGDANPRDFTQVGNTLFFVADDHNLGAELWKTDGTATGTSLVKDINLGAGSAFPTHLVSYQGLLYFAARDASGTEELWKSDGTPAGTLVVKNFAADGPRRPRNLVIMGNVLYFSATDNVNGEELWRSDGTANGTILVKDIRSGPTDSSPQKLLAMDSYLLFFADDGISGMELWKSNGSAAGTQLLKDINPIGSLLPGGFDSKIVRVDKMAYFPAQDANREWSLWKSDGTPVGTIQVKSISPYTSYGPAAFESFGAVAIGNTLFLRANGSNYPSCELWKSDGTALSTVKVHDVCPLSLVSHNGELFFAGIDSNTGDTELWKSNGTTAGTLRVKDIYSWTRKFWS